MAEICGEQGVGEAREEDEHAPHHVLQLETPFKPVSTLSAVALGTNGCV